MNLPFWNCHGRGIFLTIPLRVMLLCSLSPSTQCLYLLGGVGSFVFVRLSMFPILLVPLRFLAALSRCWTFSTVLRSGASLLSNTIAVEDAFKVHLALTSRIMVALFVAVMAYPSPSSSRFFGFCDFSGGFGLALGALPMGYWWCGISQSLVLRIFFCFLVFVVFFNLTGQEAWF